MRLLMSILNGLDVEIFAMRAWTGMIICMAYLRSLRISASKLHQQFCM
jgi:hypothetical protein